MNLPQWDDLLLLLLQFMGTPEVLILAVALMIFAFGWWSFARKTVRVVDQVHTASKPKVRQLTNNIGRTSESLVADLAQDIQIVVVTLILCLTGLLPWLIGRFLLRDSLTLERDSRVFNVEARSMGDYFMSDWMSGCSVLLIIGAIVLLRPSWAGRRMLSVALGFGIIAAVLLFLVPEARNHWVEAESLTVTELAKGDYPMPGELCAGEYVDLIDDTGQSHSYQIYIPEGCDSVEIYEGWRQVGSYDLPNGTRFIDDGPSLIGRYTTTVAMHDTDQLANSVVLLHTDSESLVFTRMDVSTAWTKEAEIVIYDESLLLAVEDSGSIEGHYLAFEPATGELLWTQGCPLADQVFANEAADVTNGEIRLQCMGESSIGDTGSRQYNIDRSGNVYDPLGLPIE